MPKRCGAAAWGTCALLLAAAGLWADGAGRPRAADSGRVPGGSALAFLERASGGARSAARERTMRVYVGTYTNSGRSRGIYTLRMDAETGRLEPPVLAAESADPSFLALHPNGRFLYAVNELGAFRGEASGAASAFRIDPESGRLLLLNQESSHGAAPCHAVVDRAGRHLLLANYGGGSVAVLPILSDGRLGPATAVVRHSGSSVDPRRQEGPHAHSIQLDRENRFAYAADLGLDKILIYRFDASRGTLAPAESPWARVAPGAGPRHTALHPNGRFLYAINELQSTVTLFRRDPESGALAEVQTLSTLPADFRGANTTAEVLVHPSGRWLYGSNRGHDSIALFTIDPRTGRLAPAGHQPTGARTPRNFGIDPTGRFLLAANQDSDSLVVFRIDPESGRLEPTGDSARIPAPVCVTIMPGDRPE